MRYLWKKLCVVCLIVCLGIGSLVSCTGGIDKDEAKQTIRDFFDAIVAEDYDGAEALLHPERPMDLQGRLQVIENETGVDLQSGIEIKAYTGVSSSYYNSTIGGSRYELTMKLTVGTQTVMCTIEIVKNEQGYGIYSFDIDA
ncbi:MAG: hypothetical protein IJW83_05310 [Clostridia bacterium]|nr:hypothetical protein [Clostridia bacterium]